MQRRTLLGIFAAGTLVWLSGCIERISGLLEDEPQHPREFVDDWQEERQPAQGEPITVETDEIVDREDRAAWFGAKFLEDKMKDRFRDAHIFASPVNGEIKVARSYIKGLERTAGVAFADLRDATPAEITIIVEGGDEYQFDVYVGEGVMILE